LLLIRHNRLRVAQGRRRVRSLINSTPAPLTRDIRGLVAYLMANTPDPTLIWFRQDLRVEDNPALIAASSFEVPILAIYVLDNETPAPGPSAVPRGGGCITA